MAKKKFPLPRPRPRKQQQQQQQQQQNRRKYDSPDRSSERGNNGVGTTTMTVTVTTRSPSPLRNLKPPFLRAITTPPSPFGRRKKTGGTSSSTAKATPDRHRRLRRHRREKSRSDDETGGDDGGGDTNATDGPIAMDDDVVDASDAGIDPPSLPPAVGAIGSEGRRVPPTPRSTTSVRPAPVRFENDTAADADDDATTTTEAGSTLPKTEEEEEEVERSSSAAVAKHPQRPLTPSDYHYLTAPGGGVNAPLAPIAAHYASNRNLLDLFSTLYERDGTRRCTVGGGTVAYAVGVKFVEVALFQIPNHAYYRSNNNGNDEGGGGVDGERARSAADAMMVTRLLGGMADGMEDRDEAAGIERAAKLQELARVADRSFEEALDGVEPSRGDGKDAKETKEEDNSGGGGSPMTRMWNDYVAGCGARQNGGGGILCSVPDITDDLRSFWNAIGGGDRDPYGSRRRARKRSKADVDNGDADGGRREEEAHHDGAKRKPTVEAVEGRVPTKPVARGKSKVDPIPERALPKPMVIPQLFIPRSEEQRSESKEEDDGGVAHAVATKDDSVVPAVAKRVSSDASDEASHHNTVADDCESEKEDGPVADESPGAPGRTPTDDSSDASMEDVVRDEPTPIAANTTVATVGVGEPSAVVWGEREEEDPPHTDVDGFDRGALELALSLSLSLSMQDDGEVPARVPSSLVSSSSDEGARDEDEDGVSRLAFTYERRYRALRDDGAFHVRFLDTFQGRNPRSSNGCTVIAPLTCVQYFCSDERNVVAASRSGTWEGGIPDELVDQVIDEHAATILPEVRGKLGLEGDAFIVPSDVHDHLIEVGLLSTSQFVGVCGGNVLDDDHLTSFRNALFLLDDEGERERLRGRKVAATFFFHGHVVALHVVEGRGEGDAEDGERRRVELIDSLPDPETWVDPPSLRRRPSQSCGDAPPSTDPVDSGGGGGGDPPRREPSDDGDWERAAVEGELPGGCGELPRNAVRVRCADAAHFDVLLRHYACSKFSQQERAFIDGNAWDDGNSYHDSAFDPRIFQAFIWAEAE